MRRYAVFSPSLRRLSRHGRRYSAQGRKTLFRSPGKEPRHKAEQGVTPSVPSAFFLALRLPRRHARPLCKTRRRASPLRPPGKSPEAHRKPCAAKLRQQAGGGRQVVSLQASGKTQAHATTPLRSPVSAETAHAFPCPDVFETRRPHTSARSPQSREGTKSPSPSPPASATRSGLSLRPRLAEKSKRPSAPPCPGTRRAAFPLPESARPKPAALPCRRMRQRRQVSHPPRPPPLACGRAPHVPRGNRRNATGYAKAEPGAGYRHFCLWSPHRRERRARIRPPLGARRFPCRRSRARPCARR